MCWRTGWSVGEGGITEREGRKETRTRRISCGGGTKHLLECAEQTIESVGWQEREAEYINDDEKRNGRPRKGERQRRGVWLIKGL